MVRDSLGRDRALALSSVLRALQDSDCQSLVLALDEAKMAGELSEECEIPLSTTYRKLETLTEATLLAEETEIDPDGHHTTRYRVVLTDDRSLAQLWSEVRSETER